MCRIIEAADSATPILDLLICDLTVVAYLRSTGRKMKIKWIYKRVVISVPKSHHHNINISSFDKTLVDFNLLIF